MRFIKHKQIGYYLQYILSVILLFIISCENIQGPNDKNNYIEPEMILIDKDLTFINGPGWDSTIVDNLPIIHLSPYYIGKYELTNKEYFQFVIDGGYINPAYWSDTGWKIKNDSNWTQPKYWGDGKKPWEEDPYSSEENTPVHSISFYEAEAYSAWLSVKTEKNYYIPFSTQWVRAAKGPDPGTMYTWGNEFDESKAHYPFGIALVPVKSFPNGKSHEGCYNLIGNAYEICVCIPFSDELENFPCYRAYYGIGCSAPECKRETMTTINARSLLRKTRRDLVGFRICRD